MRLHDNGAAEHPFRGADCSDQELYRIRTDEEANIGTVVKQYPFGDNREDGSE